MSERTRQASIIARRDKIVQDLRQIWGDNWAKNMELLSLHSDDLPIKQIEDSNKLVLELNDLMYQHHGTPFNITKAIPKWNIENKVTTDGHYYYGGRLPTVEETGHGHLLCYLAFEGRFFRASEEYVREQTDVFIEQYEKLCEQFDEDPSHSCVEVVSLNDLYYLIGISDTHFGHQWVYPNTDADRVHLKYKFIYMKKDELEGTTFEGIGEDILIIEPVDGCYPIDADFFELYCY